MEVHFDKKLNATIKKTNKNMQVKLCKDIKADIKENLLSSIGRMLYPAKYRYAW